jgi:cytoskeletal protein CcmA (bactofilin family)
MFTSSKRSESETNGPQSVSQANSGSTLVAKGVRVEGSFVSQGDVVIEGEVDGKVITSGVLFVGNEAKLKAEVSADEAVIAGQIDGTIVIKKRLELKATAKILGDISCETILVEAGASMNGKITVGSQKAETKASVKIAAAS